MCQNDPEKSVQKKNEQNWAKKYLTYNNFLIKRQEKNKKKL